MYAVSQVQPKTTEVYLEKKLNLEKIQIVHSTNIYGTILDIHNSFFWCINPFSFGSLIFSGISFSILLRPMKVPKQSFNLSDR